MISINITVPAEQAILRACHDPAAAHAKDRNGNIPLLLWSKRAYLVTEAGQKTEFGARFYLYWTNLKEIETSQYAMTSLSDGTEIALSPGRFFQEGSRLIDFRDGKLVLSD